MAFKAAGCTVSRPGSYREFINLLAARDPEPHLHKRVPFAVRDTFSSASNFVQLFCLLAQSELEELLIQTKHAEELGRTSSGLQAFGHELPIDRL